MWELCRSLILWCYYLKAFNVIFSLSADLGASVLGARNETANLYGNSRSESTRRVWYAACVYSLWTQAALKWLERNALPQRRCREEFRLKSAVVTEPEKERSSLPLASQETVHSAFLLSIPLASGQRQGEKRTLSTISHLDAIMTWQNIKPWFPYVCKIKWPF